MKKLLLTVSAIGAFCFAASSFASGGMPAPAAPGVTAGPYVGISAGIGSMDTPVLSDTQKNLATSESKYDLGGFAMRVFLGYLWNIPAIQNLKAGLEAGYNYYPENSYKIDSAKWNYNGYNIDLLGVAKYYFNNFNIIAKAGAAYVSQKYKSENFAPASCNISKTKDAILPKVAFGLGYDFNQNFGINIMYDHVFGNTPKRVLDTEAPNDSSVYKIASVNTLQLGVTYHFAI